MIEIRVLRGREAPDPGLFERVVEFDKRNMRLYRRLGFRTGTLAFRCSLMMSESSDYPLFKGPATL